MQRRAGKPWGHRDNRHPALKDEPQGLEMKKALPEALKGNFPGALWYMWEEIKETREHRLKLREEWEAKNQQMEKKKPKRRRGRVDEEEYIYKEEEEKNDEEG